MKMGSLETARFFIKKLCNNMADGLINTAEPVINTSTRHV